MATFDYLSSLEWIRAKENLVLVGPAGTGKSHTLIALGHAAVEPGFRVRYFAAAGLAEALYRGLADNSVGRLIEGLLRADLVIVDDLGFAPEQLVRVRDRVRPWEPALSPASSAGVRCRSRSRQARPRT